MEDKGKTIVKQKPKPPEPKREDLSSRMAAALERLKARDDARPEEDDGARAAAAAAAEASYAQRVGAEVRGQWALHEELAERAQAEHLEAVVGVVIQQSGAVMKKWVANSSGNAAFDAAAL
ncbi:MAG: TonB C-terminal domain-containing protein, partial [Myxococcales bacterium]|nr:TonB C-terminal domain-containing protein [Myxococcales bacterium]